MLREIVNTVRRLGSLVASALNSRNDDNNLRQVVHTHAPLCRVPLFSCSGVKEPSLNHKPPAVVFHDSLGCILLLQFDTAFRILWACRPQRQLLGRIVTIKLNLMASLMWVVAASLPENSQSKSSRFVLMVCGHLARSLQCIHRSNQVNSRNDFAIMTAL